jgi:hypothetical protein
MRVFNLTDQRVDYRGKLIPPYGSEEYDLDFIPDRDRQLEKAKMLAFGALPKWWRKPEPKPDPLKAAVNLVTDFVKEELSRPGKDRQFVSERKNEVLKTEVAVEALKVDDKAEVSFKKMKKY